MLEGENPGAGKAGLLTEISHLLRGGVRRKPILSTSDLQSKEKQECWAVSVRQNSTRGTSLNEA